jgi:hypothetical protein
MKLMTKLWIGLGVLAILSPLGLYLPAKFEAGDAWGEWDAEKIKELVGFLPSGFKKLASLWNSLLPDYMSRGWADKGFASQSCAYIAAAVIGMALCIGIVFVLGKLLAKKES